MQGSASEDERNKVRKAYQAAFALRSSARQRDSAIDHIRDLIELVPRPEWTLWAHLLIFHGRQVCHSRRPDCANCALVDLCVPERSPAPALYEGLCALIELLPGEHWDAAYVQWELGLLSALGFGLSLDRCAATGATGDNDALAYVSPRSGRAVSLSAGEPYRDRLLALPAFLTGGGEADPASVLKGLLLTGHFLERHLLAQTHKPLPGARLRYLESYRTFAHRSSGDSLQDASHA